MLHSRGLNQKWLPSRGSPMLHSRGLNQKWPTKWADWLHHPCRLGGPQCFTAGDKIKSGPQVGGLATPPIPSCGSPVLWSMGQTEKRPTSGRIGTPAIKGVPNVSQ